MQCKPAFPSHPARVAGQVCRGCPGWTLVEMIGVLVIIAILTGVISPVLVREVDRWTRKDEEARLRGFSTAFQEAVMRTRRIADATNWSAFVAGQLGMRTNDVLVNLRGNGRVFLVDPGLRIGTASGSVLPFTQDWQGSLAPVSARILLVSSISEPLPAGVASGVASSAAAFEAIWGMGVDTIPAGWTWSGRGSDLCVQRIALTPLFAEVVLNNFDGAAGKFGVDTGITNSMTTTSFSTWYLRGSVLRLHGNNGLLQSAEVIQNPVSYVYENSTWRGRAFMSLGTKRLSGQDLQDAMDLFLAAPWNAEAKNSVNQASVVAALQDYMREFLEWEERGFPYTTSLIQPVKDAQTRIGTLTTDLIFKP